MTVSDLLVEKGTLQKTKLVSGDDRALKDGEARLRVDVFGLTANNVTYAVFGDMMLYWNFFPAPEGWGRAPVWGFATVVESRAPGLAQGTRVYGYMPMSTSFIIEAGPVKNGAFSDMTAHRQPMAGVYNRYITKDADIFAAHGSEGQQLLNRPVFNTSFVIDDMIADNGFYGAGQVIFSSASSRTAYATAFLMKARKAVSVVGLTSARNKAFVESLGCYDRVVTYDAIETLDAKMPAAYVDMSGMGDVRAQLHHHFDDVLKLDLIVGATHWQETAQAEGLPGPTPQMFFAPHQIEKRTAEWGGARYNQAVTEAWISFLPVAEKACRVVEVRSLDEAAQVFTALAAGQGRPDEGHVVRLS